MAKNNIKAKNKRPKSNLATGRDYSYDKKYEASKKQISNRSKRNAARAEMEKTHGKAALKGKDVDHKKPLKSGGSNSKSNLRISTKKKNRGRK